MTAWRRAKKPASQVTSPISLRPGWPVNCGHGYFDMVGFALGVEDELGVMTQVATLHGLKLRTRDRVLRETVTL